MEVLLVIFIMVVLVLLQGFFSGSEIALVNADKFRLRHLAGLGNKGAKLVLKMFQHPEVLLGTTLVGTNISLVALTTLGTLLMIGLFGEYGLYAAVSDLWRSGSKKCLPAKSRYARAAHHLSIALFFDTILSAGQGVFLYRTPGSEAGWNQTITP